MINASVPAPTETELLYTLILELIQANGGGSPTGPASGVLSGTYPSPGFAVNMAEQTELDNAITTLTNLINLRVPTSRTINGLDLTANRTFTQDDIGDGSTYKQYSQTEKTKLAGIASGATANDTDANLKARANHTGTQTASTISDFNSAALAAAPAETANSIGGLIDAATETTTPGDTNRFALSIAGILRYVTWANIKATLKTYFDTLYAPIGGGGIGGTTGSTDNAILRADGTGGSTAQASGITIDDGNNLSLSGRIFVGGSGNYIAFGDTAFGDVDGTGDATIGFNSSNKVKLRDNASNYMFLTAGAAVASAATITITGCVFHITGTTNISIINGTIAGGWGIIPGQLITLIFDGSLTVTDGSNLKLSGNFVTTADDTLTLRWDGSNWYEVCRSTN